jgi:hypothetical protein
MQPRIAQVVFATPQTSLYHEIRMNGELVALARRLFWWKKPEEALADRTRFLARWLMAPGETLWKRGNISGNQHFAKCFTTRPPASLTREAGLTGITLFIYFQYRHCLGGSLSMAFKPRLEVLPPAQQIFWRERTSIPPHFVLYGALPSRCDSAIAAPRILIFSPPNRSKSRPC